MKKKDADMTQGTIWKQLVAFALPTMLGLIFQQLYNTVDAIVVGQFVGKEALAAVGGVGPICNTMIGLFNGLSIGATVVISQSYGAHDEKRLTTAVHTAVGASFLLGLIATALGICMAQPMLHAIGTPDDVMPGAMVYLQIYFGGITFLMLYNMCSAILRAVGDSRRPVMFLIFSAIVNTILDLLFVIAFRWGVMGVGLATMIAQALSAGLALMTLTREKGIYHLNWKKLRIDFKALKEIISIGMPAGIQQALTSFSNVFVQAHVNGFGSAAMAGWSTHNKLDSYVTIPIQSIAQASTPFVGQNWGAKKPERARKGVNTALKLALSSVSVMIVIVMVFVRPLLMLFTTDEAVLEYGVYAVQISTPFYFFMCFNQIFAGALRGIGTSKIPMFIMIFSFVIFRQIYLFIATSLSGSFFFVGFSYPAGWMMATFLLFLAYRRSALCHPEHMHVHEKNNAHA